MSTLFSGNVLLDHVQKYIEPSGVDDTLHVFECWEYFLSTNGLEYRK